MSATPAGQNQWKLTLLTLLGVGFAIAVGLGQSQTKDAPPKFEVAAIRNSKDCGDSRGISDSSPGRLTINCQSLFGLMHMAYFIFANGRLNPDFPLPSIEGGPSWINSDLYTVNAKAEGTPRQEMMRGPMLQALLEDRFKLKAHFEARGEVPVYVLTVAKGGPKLKPFEKGSCTPIESNKFEIPPPPAPDEKRCPGSIRDGTELNIRVVDMRGATLDQFSELLRYSLWGSVVDKTGIMGRFDFRLEFAVDETSPQFVAGGAAGPSIFTASPQQLGLRIDRGKEPREILIIDSVERPSEN